MCYKSENHIVHLNKIHLRGWHDGPDIHVPHDGAASLMANCPLIVIYLSSFFVTASIIRTKDNFILTDKTFLHIHSFGTLSSAQK